MQARFLFLLFLLPFSTTAQVLEDTLQFKAFQVKESKVTASVPYKSSTIDSIYLRQSELENLSEVLAAKSPVFIKSYGPNGVSSPAFRGTGAVHTKVYWNGIRMNFASLGMSDFSLIPSSFSDEIELHYGAASLADGTGGLGGALQLNNRADWNNVMHITTQASLGSFANQKGLMNLKFGNKKIQSHTRIIYGQGENDFSFINIAKEGNPVEQQRNAALKQSGAMQELYFKLNKKNVLSARVWLNDINREIPPLIISTEKEEKEHDQLLRSMIEWTGQSRSSRFTARSAYSFDRIHYMNNTDSIDSDNAIHSWISRIDATRYFSRRFTLKMNLLSDFAQAISPGLGITQQFRNSLMIEGEQIVADKLHLNVLMRYELIDNNHSELVPALGYALRLFQQKSFSVKGNIAANFNAPSLNDLYWQPGGNPELQPEKGWTVEQGMAWRKSHSQWEFEAELTGYYSRIHNWILWQPGERGYWQAQNIRDVERKGIETSLESLVKVGKALIVVDAIYSYTSSVNVTTDEMNTPTYNKQLIYIPYHLLRTGANVRYESYFIRYQHVYNGKRYIYSDNSWYLPAFWIGELSAGGGIKIGGGQKVEIRAKVANLWDQQYQAVAWRAMPGRNFQLVFKYSFTK